MTQSIWGPILEGSNVNIDYNGDTLKKHFLRTRYGNEIVDWMNHQCYM